MTAKIKDLEAAQLQSENEIKSLTHKNTQLEAEAAKLEDALSQAKKEMAAQAQTGITSENLSRKIQVLEGEVEQWEKKFEAERDEHAKTKRELDELASSL